MKPACPTCKSKLFYVKKAYNHYEIEDIDSFDNEIILGKVVDSFSDHSYKETFYCSKCCRDIKITFGDS